MNAILENYPKTKKQFIVSYPDYFVDDEIVFPYNSKPILKYIYLVKGM